MKFNTIPKEFRVWHYENGAMSYENGDGIGDGDPYVEFSCDLKPIVSTQYMIDRMPGGEYHEQTFEYEVDEAEIMQWTGRYDSEKQKVFEYDILGIYNPVSEEQEVIGVIVYDNDFGAFILYQRNGGISTMPELDANLTYEYYEVLGNVFENPELAKEVTK